MFLLLVMFAAYGYRRYSLDLPFPHATLPVATALLAGRYNQALTKAPVLPFPNPFERFLRLKRWQYQSIDTERFFIAFAVVDLNYVGNGFFYIVDKHDNFRHYETTELAPLALAAQFSPSSTTGCTRWSSLIGKALQVEVCGNASPSEPTDVTEWSINFNTTLTSKPSSTSTAVPSPTNTVQVSGSLAVRQLARDEALALVFPFHESLPHHKAVVHKGMLQLVTGSVTCRGCRAGKDAQGAQANAPGVVEVQLSSTPSSSSSSSPSSSSFSSSSTFVLHEGPALGAIDWTFSRARRRTQWSWLSMNAWVVPDTLVAGPRTPSTTSTTPSSTLSPLRRLGINLSAHVYDNAQGISQENALYLDGRVYLIQRCVVWEIPKGPSPSDKPEHIRKWVVRTTDYPPYDGACPASPSLSSSSSARASSSTSSMSSLSSSRPLLPSHSTVRGKHGRKETLLADVAFRLEFSPRGTREEHLNAGIIVSDFVQPFGEFEGDVWVTMAKPGGSETGVAAGGEERAMQWGEPEHIKVRRAFGVVEDHLAVW